MKEIKEKSELELKLEREVFGGKTEEEYHNYWEWRGKKGDLIAFSLFFGLLSLFLLIAYLLQ